MTRAELLAQLMAVTRMPRSMDGAQVQALTIRFIEIMRDFHDDVCAKALGDWPRLNQFFPTEAEFHKALAAAHKILRPAQPSPPYDDGMSDHPHGATKSFLDEFRARAPNKCAAYFDGDVSRYGDHRIGSRIKFVPEMVERVAPGLLAKHGVRIVEPHRFHPNADGTFGIEWRWA